jgi:hypothetical protein
MARRSASIVIVSAIWVSTVMDFLRSLQRDDAHGLMHQWREVDLFAVDR